jgi:CDP-diacylglycerol--glycerol-3-phosphate 3-phosphatidyltransferase
MNGIPPALRRRFGLVAAGFAAAAVTLALLVGRSFGSESGGWWLLAALPAFGYGVWFLRRSLELNRPPSAGDEDGTGEEGPVHPTLGLANAVTLFRGGLYATVAGFLFVVPPTESPWRWLPVTLYAGGAALDWVDGALARTVGRPTELGAKLDMAFDTLGFLVAPLVAVAWGRLPVWYLTLSAARYLFKFGCWARRSRGLPVSPLPASAVRRPLAGLQMAFIAVALLPPVPAVVVHVATPMFLLPSLAVFARDYLVVAGHVGEGNAQTALARLLTRES